VKKYCEKCGQEIPLKPVDAKAVVLHKICEMSREHGICSGDPYLSCNDCPLIEWYGKGGDC